MCADFDGWSLLPAMIGLEINLVHALGGEAGFVADIGNRVAVMIKP